MKTHNIKTNELIDTHIRNYPFSENTVIMVINNEIKVITKRTCNICCVLTITKDRHVATVLRPLYKTDCP